MTPTPHGHLRLAFGGLAELFLESSQYIVGRATVLTELACFVKTATAVEIGSKLTMRISYAGKEFAASGEVMRAEAGVGLGITFDSISPADQAILDSWLAPDDSFAGMAPRLKTAFEHDFPIKIICPQCQHKSLMRMSSFRKRSVIALPCGHSLWASQIAAAAEQSDSGLAHIPPLRTNQ